MLRTATVEKDEVHVGVAVQVCVSRDVLRGNLTTIICALLASFNAISRGLTLPRIDIAASGTNCNRNSSVNIVTMLQAGEPRNLASIPGEDERFFLA